MTPKEFEERFMALVHEYVKSALEHKYETNSLCFDNLEIGHLVEIPEDDGHYYEVVAGVTRKRNWQ